MKFSPLGLILVAVSSAFAQQQTKFDELASKGNLAFTQGKFGDAEKFYLEALEETKDAPDATSGQPAILNALATIYNLQGHYAEAESLCRKALTFVETASGGNDPLIASVLNTLASIDLHTGQYGKAVQSIQRAIAIRKQYFRDDDTELLADYTTLGVALCAQGNCKQANQVVQAALTLCELPNVGCQVGVATARTTLGAINTSLRRYREAEEWYRGALEIFASAYGTSNAMLVPVLSDLAALCANRNRYSEAEAAGRRALDIAAKELSDSDAAAKAALAIGQALAGQGRLEAAEPYFKQSLALHERTQGSESIEYALALQQYARFLRRAKRSSDASAIETRANAMLNRAGQKVDVSELHTHR